MGPGSPAGGVPSFLSLPVPEALFTRFWGRLSSRRKQSKLIIIYFGAVLDDIDEEKRYDPRGPFARCRDGETDQRILCLQGSAN